ncbi:hypothetical protein ADL19_14720 [Streptomyces purpurogeneiscleroticus]|nr:hypothetical protein ADL19_14720 [Streptomyces purpurogeneiscleroticus]
MRSVSGIVAALALSTMAAGCNAQQSGDGPCVATLDRFNRIVQGASRDDMKRVMQCAGGMVGSDRIGNASYETYRYLGRDPGSFMIIQVQGDTVANTMQMGLR